jgi:hypothetical protein
VQVLHHAEAGHVKARLKRLERLPILLENAITRMVASLGGGAGLTN